MLSEGSDPANPPKQTFELNFKKSIITTDLSYDTNHTELLCLLSDMDIIYLNQGWNFGRFFGPFRVQKIIFSFRKIFSQYSVPYRTRSPWNSEHSTSSTVPHRITHRQTHGVTTKAYSFNDVKYTMFSIYLIRNHEHIANITYSPSITYSLGPETKLGIPTLISTQKQRWGSPRAFNDIAGTIKNVVIQKHY